MQGGASVQHPRSCLMSFQTMYRRRFIDTPPAETAFGEQFLPAYTLPSSLSYSLDTHMIFTFFHTTHTHKFVPGFANAIAMPEPGHGFCHP